MGLIDNLFKREEILASPIIGSKLELNEVADPVFSKKVMGEGVAFINDGNEIYAPCNATVVLLPASKHAIGLKTKKGVEVLIHIGIDTVNLGGKGFYTHVKLGDKVREGDLLISYDKTYMEENNLDLITPMVITNSEDYSILDLADCGRITKGSKVLEIKRKKN